MRILENVDIPASIQALLPPKPVQEKVTKKAAKAAATDEAAADEKTTEAADEAVEVEKENENGEVEDEEDEEEEEQEEVVPAEKPAPTVRMANLCVIAGHKVNGVAAIHTQIVKEEVFHDFYEVCGFILNPKTLKNAKP